MNKWSKTQLSQIAKVTDSLHKTPKYSEEGYPMVRVTDVVQGFLKIDACLRVNKEVFDEFSKKQIPKKGDIVFSRVGSEGRTSLVVSNTNFCLGQNTALITPNNSNYFLYYWLNSKLGMAQIKKKTTGASQRTISLKSIKELELFLPDEVGQKKISDLISKYDLLIESGERSIKILEEIAQRLYIEWFVKFKFPGHEKIKMVDSGTEFGEIPEGWEVKELGKLINIKKGKNITKKTVKKGIVPVIAGGLKPAYFHNAANTLAPVITVSASGANAGYVNIYYKDIWVSDCSYVDNNTTNFIYYYYLVFKNRQQEINNLQKGAAQPHVYPKDLQKLKIVAAAPGVLEVFHNIIFNYYEEIKLLKERNETCSVFRNLLIENLVTGKRLLKD